MPNLRNGSKGEFEPGLARLQVLHSTAELTLRTKMPNLRNGSKGEFEPGLARLQVLHSTAELTLSYRATRYMVEK